MRTLIHLLILSCLLSCSQTPDEVQIKANIDNILASAQQRKVSPIMQHLTDNFSGPNNMSRQELRTFIMATFLRQRNIHIILTTPINIEFNLPDAIATFSVSASAGNSVLPDHIQIYDVTTGWKKQDDEWKLIQANWTSKR